MKIKKLILNTILLFCICTLSFSLYKIYNWYMDGKKSKDITNELKKEIEKPTNDNISIINPEEDETNDYWDYIKMDMLSVSFDSLEKKNKDTVAWIKVNGTNINYPVVKTTNNEYYLSHAYDKTKNEAGWIFADYRNNFENLDKNTIIYGHGRLDNTMFGTLKNIFNNVWYNNKNNHIIKLSTKKENTLWQVFSTYKIEAESYYLTTNFNNNEQFNTFINTLKSRSEHNFTATVTDKDQILTLSTCQDNNGNRIVIHAKLIKKQTRN